MVGEAGDRLGEGERGASASVKQGASRHPATAQIRSSLSPWRRASRGCWTLHTPHALIWLARMRTRSRVATGSPARSVAAESSKESIAPRTACAGFGIRASMIVVGVLVAGVAAVIVVSSSTDSDRAGSGRADSGDDADVEADVGVTRG